MALHILVEYEFMSNVKPLFVYIIHLFFKLPNQSRQLQNRVRLKWIILLLDCTVNSIPPPKIIVTLEVTQTDIAVQETCIWMVSIYND